MNEEAQKRILSYFIEEARDHLTTIEQVLLSLRDSMNDPELINELFRAAHSIKGGSAMLGLTSIQRTAHRMEDFFNIFRSHPGGVPVDQHLETLLLRAFDSLSMLLEELQSPRGLTEEVGNATLAELEPVFQETEKHIQNLLGEGSVPTPTPAPVVAAVARTLQQDMAEVVPQRLRQMLDLFKQRDQTDIRERLAQVNSILTEIGQTHALTGWQQLTETVGQALQNPDTDLRTLALVALRDLKQGQQLILEGRPEQVAASAELQQLAQPAAPSAPLAPLEVLVQQQIPPLLRQMLDLFKRPDDPATRPALQTLAQSLHDLGQSSGLDVGGWTSLTRLIGEILADPGQDLRQLALPVLRDLKQAHQSLGSGTASSIEPSAELLAFCPIPVALEEPETLKAFDFGLTGEPEPEVAAEPEPLFPEPDGIGAPEEWAAAGIPPEERFSSDLSWEPEPLEEAPETPVRASGDLSQGSSEWDWIGESALPETEGVEAAWDLLLEEQPSGAESEWTLEEGAAPGNLFIPDMGEAELDLSWPDAVSPGEGWEPEIASAGETEAEDLWGNWDPSSDSGLGATPPELGSEPEISLASDLEGFDPTPLGLEEEASTAFDDLFANAEELSGIEEPPPELLAPSPEPFSQDLEDLSQRLEEVKAEGDLSDLFAEVVDQAVAESLPAEPPELEWAEETGQSWDLSPSSAAEALSTWTEPPAEDSPSALDFLTYSAEPAPASDLISEGSVEEAAPEDAFDLWMGEVPGFTPGAEEATGSLANLLAESAEELAPEGVAEEANLLGSDGSSFEFAEFGAELWGAKPSDLESDLENAAADFLAEPPAGLDLDDFSPPAELSDWEDLASDFSQPAETGSQEVEFSDTLALDAEEESLEELFSTPAGEADSLFSTPESVDSAEFEDFLADEPFPRLEEFAAPPDSLWTEPETPVESGESEEASFVLAEDSMPLPPTADTEAELSFGDLFSSDDLEETVSPETTLEVPPSDLSDLSEAWAWGAPESAAAELPEPVSAGDTDWSLLEDMFPAQEEALVEPQSTDLGGIAASTEASFDRLDALFTDEADTEGLNLETNPSLSAMDADGDGQVDLDELSQFFAEEEAVTSFGEELDSPAAALMPEPELPPAPAEVDLESQLAGLFAEDDFFASESSLAAEAEIEDLDFDSGPRLDDLAALFDEGEPTATLEEPVLAPEPVATSDVGIDFEAQLESLLGDLGTAPKAPIAASVPTPTVAAPVTAPTPAVTAPSTRRTPAFSNPVMRVEVRHLDSINNLVGELVVNRNSMEQNQTRLRQFLDGLLGRVQQLGDLGQQMRDQYDRSLLESALFSSRSSAYSGAVTVGSGRYGEGKPGGSGGSNNRSGHSSGQDFDKLEMDQFTAFHTLAQEIIELIVRVRESSSDIEFAVDEAEQITRQFRQVTTQLQEGLNRARMVPFSQIADRLPRAIRDLSIKTGKQANLVVEGRDTLIDKAILEELYDPMTHLVNNALVHGIEPPEERRRAGKSPEGKITIKAFYQGNQTIMVVSDDGGGIPVDKVRTKAQRLGLLSEQADEDEVFNILFNPGFSARDEGEVDDLAGRGVGLDVVRRNISELRGSIQVDSVQGKGTTFTIRLPLTLSISKAMVCVSDKALMAFPLDGVEEMLDIPADEVQMDEQGRPTIPWRDQRLHFQPLSDLLAYSRSHNRSRSEVYSISQDEGIIPIVILQSAGQYVALQVDSFVEEQEIVIKQLRGPVAKPPGISGATVLGNGRVLPIADIIELVDMAHGRRRDLNRFWLDHRDDEPTPEEVHQTTVLIVDDSITVRELLSMSFQKVGYRVEQARDGQDAWEKLRGGLPCDLIFCDIEMPRMDGLELLTRLREDSTLNRLPVAMLTSRGAERHRQTARELGATAYFTKPYLEEELLSAAARMLEGEQLLSASPAS
ncbi:response regulator [Synechococcus sp. Nb3U1]|uniref:response regulator n=1 Tax=Synechococcus sp. Nb3U1 TaxID=1914529 RepID=UPI001F1DE565|nr:response regulator [Synechococcus sp. Nb3U1]MCF2972508.1 response regulator [Synechococcus sp. Nb3U1]